MTCMKSKWLLAEIESLKKTYMFYQCPHCQALKLNETRYCPDCGEKVMEEVAEDGE